MSQAFKEYTNNVLKTESKVETVDVDPRLLHAAMGLSTEANEILDHLKKVIFYGKDLDVVNLKEECGDLLWYYAILVDALNLDHQQIMDTNINKLKLRYGDSFDANKALNRQLDQERDLLESE